MYIKQTFKKSRPTFTRNIDNFAFLIIGVSIISILWMTFQFIFGGLALGYELYDSPEVLDRFLDIDNQMTSVEMMGLFDSNLSLFLLLFSFIGLTLGVIIASYIEGVSFLKLTTSRLKIDLKRTFLSFFLTGSASVLMIIVSILIYPENYVLNFA